MGVGRPKDLDGILKRLPHSLSSSRPCLLFGAVTLKRLTARINPHLLFYHEALDFAFPARLPALGGARRERRGTHQETAPQIVGDLADGTPPPPAPPRPVRDYQILKTTVQGQGGRNVTIHRVADPGLPERVEPIPSTIDLDDPEVQTWLEEQRRAAKRLRLTIISATVFDHEVTFLRWWVFGGEGPPEEFQAYSNVDFNHLTGFGAYEVGEMQYGILMGIGNSDAADRQRFAEAQGLEFRERALPALADDGPRYVVTQGDTNNAEGVALIDSLHELYRNERDRLITAYEGRQQARREREAFLEATPPQPTDITLHYWRKADKRPLAERGAR